MERDKKKEKNGSITVFLTLILLLVIALIGTMLETTRYSVCQIHSERTLKTAAESLCAEYNRPLYDEYRLFFLEDAGAPFETVIAQYVTDTMEPSVKKHVDLFDGAILGMETIHKVYAGDRKGEAIKGQIQRFMMRKCTIDMVQSFLKKTKGFKGVEEEAGKINEKVKREQEAATLDMNMLQLMQLIDGIVVTQGVVMNSGDFVKMLTGSEIKASLLGISNSEVWKEIKPKISSFKQLIKTPKKLLNKIKKVIDVTEKAIKEGKEVERNFKKINTSVYEDDYSEKLYKFFDGTGEQGGFISLLNSNLKILKETKTILENEENQEKLEELWKDYDTSSIAFDYTGLGEKKSKSPKEKVGSLLSDGILSLVIKDASGLSEKRIECPNNYLGFYEENGEESNCEEQLDNFVKEDGADFRGVVKDFTSYALEEFCLEQYIESFFGHYEEKKNTEKVLDYEREYILCGKSSDKENLAGFAQRLLIVRSVIHTGVLLASREKRNEAYAVAAAVVGFTGMEPLIRLTQTLILISWGMVEGLVDVAALFQGKKVPIIKKSSEFSVELSELVLVSSAMIQGKADKMKSEKNSLGYEQYLSVFLVMMKSHVKVFRIMDLMEWNIKKNYCKNFCFGTCVSSLTVKGDFQYSTKFFRMPMITRMLEREFNQFHVSPVVTYSY